VVRILSGPESGDAFDAGRRQGLLKSAIVTTIRDLHGTGTDVWNEGEVPDDDNFTIPLGVAEVKHAGTDATIVARSLMVPTALKAAEELAKEGVSCEVIDPRTIRPLDIKTIVESVKKTNRVVVAEESHPFASVGAEISAAISERAFDHLDAPVKRVSGVDVPMPYAKNLERLAIPDRRRNHRRRARRILFVSCQSLRVRC